MDEATPSTTSNRRGKRHRERDEAGGILTGVKIEVGSETDTVKRVKEEAEGNDQVNGKEKVEAKVVHKIVGGRTDEELTAFYREVHRKLTSHYPNTWLLPTPRQDAARQLKREKAQLKDTKEEEEEMSEQEEEEELEREEEEMEKVEQEVQQEQFKVKVEEKESEVEVELPVHLRRAKIEIKYENEDGEDKKARGGKREGQAAGERETTTDNNNDSKKKQSSVCGGQKTVLASLISTVLSQNTTDRNSSAAWANLKRAYNEDWERVRTAQPSQLAEVIRTGGLAQRKTAIIQGLLNQLLAERGELSLEHLRDVPTEEVKRLLTKYKGIGPKTASCVLMFNMKRDDFPVDTHVHRVSTRLGFVRGTTREQTYEFMNATMPDELKRDMHILLIRHGKQVCNARSPKCGQCLLRDDCRYGQALKKEQEMGDEEEGVGEEQTKKAKKGKTKKKTKTNAKRSDSKKASAAKRKAKAEEEDAGKGEEGEKEKESETTGRRRQGKKKSNTQAPTKRRRRTPTYIDDIEEAA